MSWLLHALAIGAMVTAAGYCAEQALRSIGGQTRFVWLATLVLTIVVPFIPKTAMPALPAMALPGETTIVVPTSVTLSNAIWIPDARQLWLLLSFLSAAMLIMSCMRLMRERTSWQRSVLQGYRVFLSAKLVLR